MNIEPERLKKFLVDANLIKEKDFDAAQKEGVKIRAAVSDMLVKRGLIEREKLTKFEAYLLGVPFVNIEKEIIPHEVLQIIPEQIARAHSVVAFRKRENNLEVAMLDPEDLATIDFIKKTDPFLKILPRLTTPEGIKNALRQYQETLDVEFGGIMPAGASGAINHKPGEEVLVDKRDLIKASQELPIVKIVDTLMKHAILQNASDVHIEPMEKEVVARFRIDGILHDMMALPVSSALGIVARIKVLSNLKLDEHRLPQDGRFKIETDDYKYSVR